MNDSSSMWDKSRASPRRSVWVVRLYGDGQGTWRKRSFAARSILRPSEVLSASGNSMFSRVNSTIRGSVIFVIRPPEGLIRSEISLHAFCRLGQPRQTLTKYGTESNPTPSNIQAWADGGASAPAIPPPAASGAFPGRRRGCAGLRCGRASAVARHQGPRRVAGAGARDHVVGGVLVGLPLGAVAPVLVGQLQLL